MDAALNAEFGDEATREALFLVLKERIESLSKNPFADPLVIAKLNILVRRYEQHASSRTEP